MKYTLLELTQAVLSSMDSDEIDSILDTTESTQVVKIIRSAYFDILARSNLPEHHGPFNLVAAGALYPIVMTLPDAAENLQWVKYDMATLTDTDPQYRTLTYLSLEDFLAMMFYLDASDDNVEAIDYTSDSATYQLIYRFDKAPSYYTTIDDNTVFFDSYSSDVDVTGLQTTKALGYGRKVIPWEDGNNFTPDLDEPQFALLLNEAKALAWAELRQATHGKAEMNAKRGWSNLQRTKYAAQREQFFDQLPNYGRK